jgi:signal transduction histidine kinase
MEDLLPQLQARFPDTPVLVALWQTNVNAAGQILRLGAADYLLKPIDPDEVRTRIGRVVEHAQAVATRARVGAAWAQTETELKQKDEELRTATRQLCQAARMAGIGELAASIAHELNNPLGTVSLRVESLLARTTADDPRRLALDVIDEEVERMGRLVGNLLRFSRSGTGISTVDVRDEVTQTLELIAHHMRKSQVQAGPEFEPGVPVIQADRQQLRQVLLNLFTNAIDAMPNGGRLTPRVRTGRLGDGRPGVVLEVEDSGCGIPADVLPQVTEPFFTTKAEGRGTGLGLSVCKKIIDQHQGLLEVESAIGVGTTVRVTLPARTAKTGDEPHSG